ncbi:MAG: hypothetical protein ACRDND_18475, partial [Streptosporangiaceae bacterium]
MRGQVQDPIVERYSPGDPDSASGRRQGEPSPHGSRQAGVASVKDMVKRIQLSTGTSEPYQHLLELHR